MSDEPELVLVLKCKGCRRKAGRLLRWRSTLYWGTGFGMGQMCVCGRFRAGLPDESAFADRVAGVQGVSIDGHERAPVIAWG